MARPVHAIVPVLFAATSACVVPPPLGLDEVDAGADSAPVILSVRGPDDKELAQPGATSPLTILANQGDATITLYDADAADTLTLQVFVDYSTQAATAPRSICTAPPPSDTTAAALERTITCPMKTLCIPPTDTMTGNVHFLLYEVYDRTPTNDPLLFRSVPPPGMKSSIGYLMTCVNPTQ